MERPGAAATLNPFLAELGAWTPDYLTTNLLMEHPDAQRAWATNRQALRAIAARASTAGSRVLFVIVPSTAQVDASHFAFYRSLGFTVDPRTLTTAVPQDAFAALCRDEGWTCLDLLPAFRRAAPAGPLYLDGDDHWNDDGYALAFAATAAAIEQHGLIR